MLTVIIRRYNLAHWQSIHCLTIVGSESIEKSAGSTQGCPRSFTSLRSLFVLHAHCVEIRDKHMVRHVRVPGNITTTTNTTTARHFVSHSRRCWWIPLKQTNLRPFCMWSPDVRDTKGILLRARFAHSSNARANIDNNNNISLFVHVAKQRVVIDFKLYNNYCSVQCARIVDKQRELALFILLIKSKRKYTLLSHEYLLACCMRRCHPLSTDTYLV